MKQLLKIIQHWGSHPALATTLLKKVTVRNNNNLAFTNHIHGGASATLQFSTGNTYAYNQIMC
jgi:hypothetical protein